jgi:integrase/recombinase XerD
LEFVPIKDKGNTLSSHHKKDPKELEIRAYLSQMAYEAYLMPLTLENYGRDLRAFASWVGEGKDFSGVEQRMIDQYLRELGSLIGPRSLARHLSSLRGFFRWRSQEYAQGGKGAENPCENVEGPKLPQHLPGVLSVEEVERLIRSAEGDDPVLLRDRAMLETAYSCGLRVSELVGLRRRSLMLDEDLVRVLGKGEKERLVPLGEHAKDALNRYLRAGRDFIRGNDRKGNLRPLPDTAKDVLFLNQQGRPLTRFGFWRILRLYLERCGIDTALVHPHTFRHTFATHLIEGGADLRVVQELLGHASISTTEIYTHLDRDYLRETIRTFHPRG